MNRILKHMIVGRWRKPKRGPLGKYYSDEADEVYVVLNEVERTYLACTCRGFARGKRQGKPPWERHCMHTQRHAVDLEVWAEERLAELAGKWRVTLTCPNPDCMRPINITYEASRLEPRHVACDCGEVWAVSECGKTITPMSAWVNLMRDRWMHGLDREQLPAPEDDLARQMEATL